MTTWTRVTDPEVAVALMPGWFAARMLASRGSYGFLLATGDVVRVSRVAAIHVASEGLVLVDVLLDHAGLPDGVDTAWRAKHFLGAPVPGANLATLTLAQIVMAVEFTAAEIVETANDIEMTASQAALGGVPVTADAIVVKNGTTAVPVEPVQEAGGGSFPASNVRAWIG